MKNDRVIEQIFISHQQGKKSAIIPSLKSWTGIAAYSFSAAICSHSKEDV